MIKKSNEKININLLLEQIEKMREELVDIGLRDGLTAPSTLEYSQLLDERIKVYQKMLKDT
ncbi:aspartyl-phosphate phosphatase Spo0E family protein [Gracilibacillus suaedae]|uniref:aspartyl-phosphate phosphatase Spo0E family protein n=1 Tax=Gracilibacillus suaedae TaxID=2820273 RepID=UPI001E440765|nr:aspartyl-phosphate phosphatase Spo0E family protein [Gracilibacillus suaedae]